MTIRLPQFTIYYAAACVIIWFVLAGLGLDEQAILRAGFWPARGLTDSNFGGIHLAFPAILTPVTSAFVHGDLGHVASNMMFLVIAGWIVERRIGIGRTIILSVAGAYGAALGFAFYPFTDGSVAIGASGVISALIAAAITATVSFGTRRIGKYSLDTILKWTLAIFWIVYQLYISFLTPSGGSIAIGAHIGGFIVGLILGRPLSISAKRQKS